MSLIDDIRAMSLEERREFNQLLQEEDKPEPEVRQLGEPMHGPNWDTLHNRYLSPEEEYDKKHPLEDIWPYGLSMTSQAFGQDPVVRYYTDQEVAAHNEPIIQDWLEEKRKHFPDAKRPSVPRVSDSQNHYTFSRW